MKHKYIFAFLMLSGSISPVIARGTLLIGLDQKEVEKHAQLIERELLQNAWHKRAAILFGLCATTYGAYYFFKGPSIPTIPAGVGAAGVLKAQEIQAEIPQDIPNSEIKADIAELKKLIATQQIDKSVVNQMIEFINLQAKKESSGFTGTLKNWGKTTLNFVIRESAVAVVFSAVIGAFGKYFRSLDSAIDSVLYKVFHPGDLQWYIETHTNIYNLCNDLEWHASCIENRRLPKKVMSDGTIQAEVMLNEEQVAYHIQAFSTTWSLCVKEFELILGFMLHKIQQVEKQVKDVVADQESSLQLLEKRYIQIREHICQLVENFRLKADELLRADTTMRTGLVQAVSRLRLLFSEERSAFTNCEK